MLSIYLLGQPYLAVDNHSIMWSAPPRALPLLAYLLVHRTQVLERQQVANQIWPDETEKTARANLRRHLHWLGKMLPDPDPDQPWLLATATTLCWNLHSPYWLDIQEFEQHTADVEKLSEAAALYRGDLLESNYDDWVFFERERLRELYLQTLGSLILHKRSDGQYPEAIQYAQTLLLHDPFREDTVRQLISLQYEIGNRAGALAEFERFVVQLKQEMGVSPMPETLATYETVLRYGRLSGERLNESFMDTEWASPAQKKHLILPMVGRRAEMERLATRWSRAARGHGGVLWVSGEAGVGKTRLTHEFALIAESQGARVLHGATSGRERFPYQAISEAFQNALPLLANLSGETMRLSVLSALLPDLKKRCKLPDLPLLPHDQERLRLFDAAAGCLEKLSEPRPLLLVLEDLHWAGESTLSLLEFLTRRLASKPVLILATYREEEIHRSHVLREVRRTLAVERLADQMALGRLDIEAVSGLFNLLSKNGALRADNGSKQVEELFAASEGLPLFLNLLVDQWLENCVFSEEALSINLKDAIEKRLSRLTATGRAYAEVAAVVGQMFDPDVVRDVGGWSEAQALEALGELLDQQVVKDLDRRTEFIFSHHLIQNVLYQVTPPSKRKKRHLRAAEILEDLYPQLQNELAAQLATHFDLGGVAERAISCYLLAAQQCLLVFAVTEALAWLTRALQLGRENPASVSPRMWVDLLMMVEGIYYQQGDSQKQAAILEELEVCVSTIADQDLSCELLKRRILYFRRIDYYVGQKKAIEELQEKSQGNARWQTEAIMTEGNYRKLINENDLAVNLLKEAFDRYGDLNDLQGQMVCCCMLAEIFIITRQSVEASVWAYKALELCRDEFPTEQFMYTLWNMSAHGLINKNIAVCLQYAQKLLTAAEKSYSLIWQAAAHRLIGMASIRTFSIAEARQRLKISLELYQRIQKQKGCSLTLQSLGNVEIAVGNGEKARDYHQRSYDIEEKLHNSNGKTSQLINLALAAALNGDFEAERNYAHRAISIARQSKNRFLEATALQNLGEAERELENYDRAIQFLIESQSSFDDPSLINENAGVLGDLALTYTRVKDLSSAQVCVEKILDLYPQVESQMENAHRLLWVAADIYHQNGQADRAAQCLGRAYEAFQSNWAAIPDEESRQMYLKISYNRKIVAAYERREWK